MITFVLDNQLIKCTHGHKFYLQGTWVEAAELAIRTMETCEQREWDLLHQQFRAAFDNKSLQLWEDSDNETCFRWVRVLPDNDCKKGDTSGKSHTIKIHRLVAKEFVPNPMNLPEVNHKDGNKKNNNYENLEWVTHRQNVQHSFANKLQTNIGSKNPISKLTEQDIMEIRQVQLPLSTQKMIDLSKKYGVAIGTIKGIVYRPDSCWIHVK
jgi:hypothetical protein